MKMSKRLSAGIATFLVAAFMVGGISGAQAMTVTSVDSPTTSAEWTAKVAKAEAALKAANAANDAAWNVLVAAKRAKFDAQVINDGKSGHTKKTIQAVELATAAVKTYQAKFDASEDARWKAISAYGQAINDSKAAAAKAAAAKVPGTSPNEPACYLLDCRARDKWRVINAATPTPTFIKNIMFATFEPLYTQKTGAVVSVVNSRSFIRSSTEMAYGQIAAASPAKLKCYKDATLLQLSANARMDNGLKAYDQFQSANALYGFVKGSWTNRAVTIFKERADISTGMDWALVVKYLNVIVQKDTATTGVTACSGM